MSTKTKAAKAKAAKLAQEEKEMKAVEAAKEAEAIKAVEEKGIKDETTGEVQGDESAEKSTEETKNESNEPVETKTEDKEEKKELGEDKQEGDEEEQTDEVPAKKELSGHNIDYAFKSILEVEKTIPTIEVSSAGYTMIETLRQECDKEDGNEAIPAFIKNIGTLFDDGKLNNVSIGLPQLMWQWSSESRVAYETITSVAIAIHNGELESLGKLNVLRGFSGEYAEIGEKLVANYFD